VSGFLTGKSGDGIRFTGVKRHDELLPGHLELAKACCEACPLRRPCLAGAVERGEPCGVWGGEIFERGRIIAFKRPRGHPGRQARAS